MNMSNLLASIGGLSPLDSKGFKQLLDSQSLVDCTLACDGGKISAHKVVLSACSSYLAKILQEHPVEHPIIILPELNIDDVNTLVHYMYTGELLKSQTLNSASLLRTAATLSVNSLNDFLSGAQTAANTFNLLGAAPIQANPLNTTSHQAPTGANNQLSSMIGDVTNTISSNNNNNNNSNSNNHINNNTINLNETLSVQSNGLNGKSEFQFKCPVCHNDFQTICSFEYHMQRVHQVTSFGCEICHKPFASLRYVLTDHMRRCHGWKADQC